MIDALSLGKKAGIEKGKRKIQLFSLVNRKITFGLVYITITVKSAGFLKNHVKHKTLLLFTLLLKDTISWLCLSLSKCQPGLNAGGPIRIGHIAPFLPFFFPITTPPNQQRRPRRWWIKRTTQAARGGQPAWGHEPRCGLQGGPPSPRAQRARLPAKRGL